MTLIRRTSPVADLVSFRDAMDRVFDERLFRPLWLANAERQAVPALDLYATPEAVIAKVALPGVKPENVDVSIDDDIVTITGSFKEEKETTRRSQVIRFTPPRQGEDRFRTPPPPAAKPGRGAWNPRPPGKKKKAGGS